MTDTFMGHREEFEEYRDDAASAIKALTSTASQSARDDLVKSAHGYISEAERLLRILEVEARGGNTQTRNAMQTQIKNFKQQVATLKADLERKKLVGSSQQRAAQRPANDVNASQKDALIRTQQQIDRNDDLLYDADVVIEETNQVAANITNNLHDQRRMLNNARDNVDNTHEDAVEAGDHLKSLQRKHSIQIATLYVVVVLLVIGIIASVIAKFS